MHFSFYYLSSFLAINQQQLIIKNIAAPLLYEKPAPSKVWSWGILGHSTAHDI
jgi:hypothetical protein